MTEIENWRDIEGYEGFYQVSSLGRVKSLGRWVSAKGDSVKFIKERILKPRKNPKGYLQVVLYNGEKVKSYYIHRLVGKSFLPNSNNLTDVNHIDENKTNNRVDNLEWCDRTYNIRYSQTKPVNQFTLDGKFIRRWDCMKDIKYSLGFSDGYICDCCKGKHKSAYGFIWRYAN